MKPSLDSNWRPYIRTEHRALSLALSLTISSSGLAYAHVPVVNPAQTPTASVVHPVPSTPTAHLPQTNASQNAGVAGSSSGSTPIVSTGNHANSSNAGSTTNVSVVGGKSNSIQ